MAKSTSFVGNDSILSVLDFVRSSLPISLINAEGYARLAAVAGMLPAHLTTFYGLECRLGRPEALADIAFEIKNASKGQRLLAGQFSSSMDGICAQWPVWQRLRTFATDWAEPNHPFHEHIRNIWLEFDTAAESGEKSPPPLALTGMGFLSRSRNGSRDSPPGRGKGWVAESVATATPFTHPYPSQEGNWSPSATEDLKNPYLPAPNLAHQGGEMPNGAELIRQPCIFFSPDAKAIGKERLLNVILNTITVLGGTSGQMRETLRTFLVSLPDGARLFQIGLMLSRGNQGLRVCVNHLDLEAIPGWLSELRWQGDTRAFAALLQRIAPLVRSTALGVTLTEGGLAKKIGLECYMNLLEEDSKQWIPLLDFLDELGLCLPQKRQGLLDFPGVSRSPAERRKSADGIFYLNTFRKIHHLKLSIRADRIVEAKAYLALRRPGVRFDKIFAEFSGPAGFESSEDAWLIE